MKAEYLFVDISSGIGHVALYAQLTLLDMVVGQKYFELVNVI